MNWINDSEHVAQVVLWVGSIIIVASATYATQSVSYALNGLTETKENIMGQVELYDRNDRLMNKNDIMVIDVITSVNGTAVNGTAVNGTAVNGTAVNGTAVNGTAVNGTAVNGTAVNGTAVNGTAVNGTAVNGTAVNGTAVNGISENTRDLNAMNVDLNAMNVDLNAMNVDLNAMNATNTDDNAFPNPWNTPTFGNLTEIDEGTYLLLAKNNKSAIFPLNYSSMNGGIKSDGPGLTEEQQLPIGVEFQIDGQMLSTIIGLIGEIGPGKAFSTAQEFLNFANEFVTFLSNLCDVIDKINEGCSNKNKSHEINRPPLANAGSNQRVYEGTNVTLNGFANDPDPNDTVRYSWEQIGSPSIIFGGETSNPSFIAPNVSSTTSLIFKFTASDTKEIGSDNVTITVEAIPNRPPLANAKGVLTASYEDIVNLYGNASRDPDGYITKYLWNQTSGPHVNINGNSSSIATFKAPRVSNDTELGFILSVTDNYKSTGKSDPLSIIVRAVNHIPTAGNKSITVEGKDKSVIISLTGIDVDNDPLAPIIVTKPFYGNISSLANSVVTYVPDSDYFGQDRFTYKVNDGKVNSSNTATVFITIISPNMIPEVRGQNVTTDRGKPIDITLKVNDTDNSDIVVLSIDSVPLNGKLTSINRTDDNTYRVMYTPNKNFIGKDRFAFKANDGKADSNLAFVNITVSEVNSLPIVVNDQISIEEDAPTEINVLNNDFDPDADDILTVAAVDQGAIEDGSLHAITRDNKIKFTPAPNFSGIDTFTYTVEDNSHSTGRGNVTVNVGSGNDNPIAVDDTANVTEDKIISINVLANDDDIDADNLVLSAVTQAANGSAKVINGSGIIRYTPHANFSGDDFFTYTVEDGNFGSAAGNVVVTVKAVNDTPTGYGQLVTTSEDIPVRITLNGSDVEDGDNLIYTIISKAANGKLGAIDPTMDTVDYAPHANYHGPDTFTFRAKDTINLPGPFARVDIEVKRVNDPPLAHDHLFISREDTATTIILNASDVDGDILTYETVIQPLHGTLLGIGPQLVYTPNKNFIGKDRFAFKANDGKADSNLAFVNITVSEVNNPPLANAGPNQAAFENRTVMLNGSTSLDPDGGQLRLLWKQIEPWYNITLNDKNIITPTFISPNINHSAVLTFRLTVVDDKGALDDDTVDILVLEAPQPPIDMVLAIDSSTSMKENDPNNIRLDIAKHILEKANSTKDRAGIISWDRNTDFVLGPTSNFDSLITHLVNVDNNGPTDLDSGITSAIRMHDENIREGSTIIIIILTDGKGDFEYSNMGPVINDSKNKGYRIFPIGINITSGSPEENALTDIALATGGKYLSNMAMRDLDETIDSVLFGR